MKSIWFMVLMVIPTAIFAKSGFIINGKFDDKKDGWVYLTFDGGVTLIDSSRVINGSFIFQGTVEERMEAGLLSDAIPSPKQEYLQFYLTNEVVSIVSKSSLSHAVVSSNLNTEYELYLAGFKTNLQQMFSLIEKLKKVDNSVNDQDSLQVALRQEINELQSKRFKIIQTYAENNQSSFFSLVALETLLLSSLTPEINVIEKIYEKLDANLKETLFGKRLAVRFSAYHNAELNKIAPSFTQNDINGKPVSLNDFRGKYLLIDFWATWCAPCLAENPSLLKSYRKYKHMNFEILAVSLDPKSAKSTWLNIIKANSLEWIHISDLKGMENAVGKLYGIQYVPQNFLLDPNGKIIAKNIHGGDLDKRLEEILGVQK